MTDEMEQRLQSALSARAAQITPERLRFGTPPTVAAPARRFSLAPRRWVPVLAVAVVAVILGFVLRSHDPAPQPILPAEPSFTAPSSAAVPATSPAATPSRTTRPEIPKSLGPASTAESPPAATPVAR